MRRKILGLLLGFLLGAFLGSLVVALFVPVTGKQFRTNVTGNFRRARQAAKTAETKRREELEAELAHLKGRRSV